MNCLRYRVKIQLNDPENNEQNRLSIYETLLDLLQEFDASGRAEIFRLLLERRSPIPLFLPNGEHHLLMLKLLNRTTANREMVCIGEDVDLLRVTIISCREKEDSQTAELLKDVFNVDSLHREDFASNCFTRKSTTAEIALGCVQPRGEKKEPVHLLVLNVVGNFDPLWDFIKEFSDYLIIEDPSSDEETEPFNRLPGFPIYKGSSNCSGLEGIGSVLVWKPSTRALVANNMAAGNELGFEHLQIKTSRCQSFNDKIVESLLPKAEALHQLSKEKKMLRKKLFEISKLLPNELKAIECSVSFDIKSSVGKVNNFSKLRIESFLLQTNFNEQAKYEENKAQNKNDELIKNELNRQIEEQKTRRKEMASTVEKHPLLELLVQLISMQDVSMRVLGFRELEKSLAQKSETAIGPLRKDIDILSREYAELSQQSSNNRGGSSIQLDSLLKQLYEVKETYNSTVVSTEHIWRELSHLYAADKSKYGK